MSEQGNEFEPDVEGHKQGLLDDDIADVEGHRQGLLEDDDTDDVEGHRIMGTNVQPPRDADLGNSER